MPYTQQREAWNSQYAAPTIPTCHRDDPSHGAPLIMRTVAELGYGNGWVLDVGCGNGRNASFFAARGFSVLGFDISKTALDAYRGRAERSQRPRAVHCILQSMTESFAVKPRQFVGAVCFTALENLADPEDLHVFRDELSRAILPHGFCAIYYLTPDDGYYKRRIVQTEHGLLVTDDSTGLSQRIFRIDEIAESVCPSFRLRLHTLLAFPDVRADVSYSRQLGVAVFDR